MQALLLFHPRCSIISNPLQHSRLLLNKRSSDLRGGINHGTVGADNHFWFALPKMCTSVSKIYCSSSATGKGRLFVWDGGRVCCCEFNVYFSHSGLCATHRDHNSYLHTVCIALLASPRLIRQTECWNISDIERAALTDGQDFIKWATMLTVFIVFLGSACTSFWALSFCLSMPFWSICLSVWILIYPIYF